MQGRRVGGGWRVAVVGRNGRHEEAEHEECKCVSASYERPTRRDVEINREKVIRREPNEWLKFYPDFFLRLCVCVVLCVRGVCAAGVAASQARTYPRTQHTHTRALTSFLPAHTNRSTSINVS